MRLADRPTIVTGAGSGIGRAIAKTLASEGAPVAVVDRLGDKADEVRAEIEAAGGAAISVKADISVPESVDAMVEAAEDAFGRVDVLVNNAAVCNGDNLALMSTDDWETDIAVDLTGVFLCSRRVLRGMIERRGGSIVNIASVNGLAYFGNEAYSAAKAGVISLTTSMAVRYGRYDIRTNAIAPGSIRTPIWQERVDTEPEVFEQLVKWYPLGRIGEPEDVANAVLFLASDEAAWVTGVVLRVDGGLLAGNGVMTQELLVESRGQEV